MPPSCVLPLPQVTVPVFCFLKSSILAGLLAQVPLLPGSLPCLLHLLPCFSMSCGLSPSAGLTGIFWYLDVCRDGGQRVCLGQVPGPPLCCSCLAQSWSCHRSLWSYWPLGFSPEFWLHRCRPQQSDPGECHPRCPSEGPASPLLTPLFPVLFHRTSLRTCQRRARPWTWSMTCKILWLIR